MHGCSGSPGVGGILAALQWAREATAREGWGFSGCWFGSHGKTAVCQPVAYAWPFRLSMPGLGGDARGDAVGHNRLIRRGFSP